MPIILLSSCKNARAGGDARYNGGLKLYSLWVKLLRQHGYPAYIVTWNGSYQPWMIDHQPHISIETARRWHKGGLPIRFVTGWADASAFTRLADELYFYDCEIAYTTTKHRGKLDRLMDNKVRDVITHSRTQQAWYMATYDVTPTLLPIWSDEEHWLEAPERRREGTIGYMDESAESQREVELIVERCSAAGHKVEPKLISGDESAVLSAMQECDIFVGLNHGKHPLWGEGSPIPPAEAMHAGAVVVAYDVHGNREYLLDGFNGFVVARRDTEAMARRVIELLSDRAQTERFRGRSLDFAKAYLSAASRWPVLRDFLGLEELAPEVDDGLGRVVGLDVAGIRELLGDEAYIGEEEISTFARHAAQAHGTLVEIGAAYGASSLLLLAAAPAEARVVSLDPFVSDSMSGFQVRPSWCRANVARGLKKLGLTRRLQRWSLRVEPSYEAIVEWRDDIDFLFIDGDHTYEAVRRDFDDWVRYVVPGGTIVLHDSRRLPEAPEADFARGWQGPTRLATELATSDLVELVDEAFSMTFWRRTDVPAAPSASATTGRG